jgi:tellurite resistance protein
MGRTFKDDKHKTMQALSRKQRLEATKHDNANRFSTRAVPSKKRREKFDWRRLELNKEN